MMIDVGTWVATVAEVGVGYLMGSTGKRWAVKKARKTTRAQVVAEIEAAKPKVVCNGCGHAFSFHKGMGLPCSHVEHLTESRKVPVKHADGTTVYDAWNAPLMTKETVVVGDIPCTCQAYSGPEPLPEVVSY